MTADTKGQRRYGFVIGLVTGTLVGAGLTAWLAPRAASELRARVTDSARRVRREASGRYQVTSARVDEAVDDLARKGRGVRNVVADAIVRGAHEVERHAKAAKGDADGAKQAPPV
jgi:gas vesicle protein